MRKLLATITMALVAAAGLAVVAGTPAGAQPLTCTFTVTPTTLTAPGTVQVSGVAPGTTEVQVLVDGVVVATVQSAPVSGAWGPVTVNITATSTISIALPSNYATLPCIGNGGTDTVTITVGGGALPRTGSNDTGRYVFTGVALVAIGLVLVVATRRRRAVATRA